MKPTGRSVIDISKHLANDIVDPNTGLGLIYHFFFQMDAVDSSFNVYFLSTSSHLVVNQEGEMEIFSTKNKHTSCI